MNRHIPRPSYILTDHEYATSGARFLARQFGLTRAEAEKLALHSEQKAIIDKVAAFRDKYAVATSSPMARGELLRLLRKTKSRRKRLRRIGTTILRKRPRD